jgi:hypothetical protein
MAIPENPIETQRFNWGFENIIEWWYAMSKLLDMPVNKNARTACLAKKFTKATALMILFSRITLFVVFQLCFYALFAVLGKDKPWMMAAAYWPFVMVLTNIVCVILLSGLLKREGSRFRDFFAFNKGTVLKDLLLSFGLLFVIGGLGFFQAPCLAIGSSVMP